MRGTIILDGAQFDADIQPMREQFITPWLAKLGAGEPRFSDLAPASHWVLRDFSGGFGKDEGDIFEDTTKFWDSTCWTHIDGRVHIPPLAVAGAFDPAAPNFYAKGVVVFRGQPFVYGVGNTGVRPLYALSSASATWAAETAAGTPATGSIVNCATVVGQDLLLGMNAADIIRFDGTTYSAPLVGARAAQLCAFQGQTAVKTANPTTGLITISTSTDRGVTWTDIVSIPSMADATGLAPFRWELSTGTADVVAVGTREGVWVVDITNSKAYPAYLIPPFAANCHVFAVAPGSGDDASSMTLYFQVGTMGLWELHPDGRVINVGLDRDDGLPETRANGVISSTVVTADYVYVSTSRAIIGLGTTTATLGDVTHLSGLYVLDRRTRAWHHLALHTTANLDTSVICLSNWFNPAGSGIPVPLYFFYGATGSKTDSVKYQPIPRSRTVKDLELLTQDTGIAYLVTPWFNAGFFNLPKVLLTVTGQVKALDDVDKSIALRYAINGAAYTVNADTNFTAATTWSTTSSIGGRLSLWRPTSGSGITTRAGVVFNNRLRLKVKLLNAVAAAQTLADGPRLDHLVTSYIAVPSRLSAWSVRVYNTGKFPAVGGATPDGFYDEVLRIASVVPPVRFYPYGTDAGVVTPTEFYYVRVSTMSRLLYDGSGIGYVDLVLTEPVQSVDDPSGEGWHVLA